LYLLAVVSLVCQCQASDWLSRPSVLHSHEIGWEDHLRNEISVEKDVKPTQLDSVLCV